MVWNAIVVFERRLDYQAITLKLIFLFFLLVVRTLKLFKLDAEWWLEFLKDYLEASWHTLNHIEGLSLVALECRYGASIVDNPREAVQKEVDLLVRLFDFVCNVNLIDIFVVKLCLNDLANTLSAHLTQLVRDPRSKAKICVFLFLGLLLYLSEVLIGLSANVLVELLFLQRLLKRFRALVFGATFYTLFGE